NLTLSPDPNYGIPSANPQIVFTQGTANGTVPGGEMAIIWNRINGFLGGYAIDRSQPDLGVASQPAAAAVEASSSGGLVTDAIFGPTPPSGTQLPDIIVTTAFPVTISIPPGTSDANFANFIANDVSVTVGLFHPHLNEVLIQLQ